MGRITVCKIRFVSTGENYGNPCLVCKKLRWGSTIKLSIELPVTNRHRRDMTEKLSESNVKPEPTNLQWYRCICAWKPWCTVILKTFLRSNDKDLYFCFFHYSFNGIISRIIPQKTACKNSNLSLRYSDLNLSSFDLLSRQFSNSSWILMRLLWRQSGHLNF